MQAQRALLNFTDSEKKLGDRLIGIALEIDRIEGYSEPHAVVMAVLAEKLAVRLGIHGSDLTALKYAALAHDIGERAMKRNYLLRPDDLTWEETLDLWRHPILGEQAAAEIGLPRHTQLLIRWHHERWNGLGYPDGLSGESIPIGARILRLVDTYFALRAKRPHRMAHQDNDAIQMISDRAGLEFDPALVGLLLTLHEEDQIISLPEPPIADADTFTILTPEGLQTAVVPHTIEHVIAEETESPPARFSELTDPDASILELQSITSIQSAGSDPTALETTRVSEVPESDDLFSEVKTAHLEIAHHEAEVAEPSLESPETKQKPAPENNEG